jgi:hypothetical protein
MSDKIECKRYYDDLRIYINDNLHLHFKVDKYNGLQSWFEGTNSKRLMIEIYFNDNTSIVLGYEKTENWMKVLNLLDQNL